jgi:hypothetical protein
MNTTTTMIKQSITAAVLTLGGHAGKHVLGHRIERGILGMFTGCSLFQLRHGAGIDSLITQLAARVGENTPSPMSDPASVWCLDL